ncbi:MAG: hypothetical protein LQ340_001418 [Diploschistes diacapsis]|nr:MAG: hypothetical protein LQ340_001418 [Diploschistes diacapsis]
MNDDPSASTSFTPGSDDRSVVDAAASSSTSFDHGDGKAKIQAQQTRRAHFLDNLSRNIDIVIYCQLSILYYMECSLFRFFIRAIPHWILFTPKPSFFPTPPSNRPYVSSIVLANGFCALVHLFMARPEGGEAMRGYLHGGLLIDFVGELGPISRWRMLLIDTLIALLQIVILGVTLERRDLRIAMNSPSSTTAGLAGTPLGASLIFSAQDLDAEEQGIRRSQEGIGDTFEMVALNKNAESDEAFLSPRRRNEHALDAYYSGDVVIAHIDFTETVHQHMVTKLMSPISI